MRRMGKDPIDRSAMTPEHLEPVIPILGLSEEIRKILALKGIVNWDRYFLN